MSDADLIKEWNERLKDEGLTVTAGEHSWLRYSRNPEAITGPPPRDFRRIAPRTAKICERCGVKFFGRPNQRFHHRDCKENFRKFGPRREALPPKSAREK